MKKLIMPMIVALLFCAACGDNENEQSLLVGVTNENVNIHTLNPPMQIAYGHPDSIDLEGDLSYDLLIFQTLVPAETGFAAETRIAGRNELQVILSSVNVYPDTLEYGNEISNASNWSDTSKENRILHGLELSGFNHYTLTGNFLGFTEHYLGIRKESRFGWVKMKRNADNGNMEVLEWAMMK
ncbi:MAG: hypothetical protein IPH84_08860 [Bacteroidales bacterium]|nr:hypothetical protein [Bacteroidales bacterium]